MALKALNRSQSEGGDRVVLQACYDLGSKLQGGEAIAKRSRSLVSRDRQSGRASSTAERPFVESGASRTGCHTHDPEPLRSE
ncbi:hypothetical protein [Baaleninema simplex]|uniref:hypothetical protein n=1 Tax=Baaleninema simplex TaxID=2862350 RepID=UPI00034B6B61|nr:hypothetical protein [Baaleninema simplex]